jgi:hypothetical protein
MTTWDHNTVGKFLLDALKRDDTQDLAFLYAEEIWDLKDILESIKFSTDEDYTETVVWSFLKNTYPINENKYDVAETDFKLF